MKLKTEKLNQEMILKALDFTYDKAVNGMPGIDSAVELAENFMKNDRDTISNCNSLIRWQVSKAGTSGFLTGLGGLITMPVAIPANLASVMFVQIRMIAAIAYIGGYDLKDDRVQSLIYMCMAGNGVNDIVKDVGIFIGQKVTTNIIKNISGKTISAINKKIGFRLLTKFGETGAINLGKTIPIIGGIIGGTFDSIFTNSVGKAAIKIFINSDGDTTFLDKVEINKLYCYINLIKIDNVIDNAEIEFIEKQINDLEINDEIKIKVMNKIHSSNFIPVDYEVLKQSKMDVINLLNNLILLAKRDGNVHKAERMLIEEIANDLNFSLVDLEDMFKS